MPARQLARCFAYGVRNEIIAKRWHQYEPGYQDLMENFKEYLQGGDLRSIAKVDELIELIKTQKEFDILFQYLHSENRLIAMRAIDTIEKITLNDQKFLSNHNQDIIKLIKTATDKEIKWHVALLTSRIDLTDAELTIVWKLLKKWAGNRKESKIVRVNSIQSLFNLSQRNDHLKEDFESIIQEIKIENIPSIDARLRKLKII